MKYLIYFSLFILFSITGCSKFEGDEGPAGKDGNANVHVALFSVGTSEWENSNYVISVEKPIDIITQAISDSGAVLLYQRSSSNGSDGTYWQQLPYTWLDYDIVIRFWYKPGWINIQELWRNDDPIMPDKKRYYKLITIASKEMIPSSLDLKNYDDVSSYFDIE